MLGQSTECHHIHPSRDLQNSVCQFCFSEQIPKVLQQNLSFQNVFGEHYSKVVMLAGQWLYFILHVSFERATIELC